MVWRVMRQRNPPFGTRVQLRLPVVRAADRIMFAGRVVEDRAKQIEAIKTCQSDDDVDQVREA